MIKVTINRSRKCTCHPKRVVRTGQGCGGGEGDNRDGIGDSGDDEGGSGDGGCSRVGVTGSSSGPVRGSVDAKWAGFKRSSDTVS